MSRKFLSQRNRYYWISGQHGVNRACVEEPIVEELAEEGYCVGKIDVDQQPGLAQQFRIMSIPTLLIFKDGKEAERLVGLTPKAAIKELLDK